MFPHVDSQSSANEWKFFALFRIWPFLMFSSLFIAPPRVFSSQRGNGWFDGLATDCPHVPS